jgi:Firmicute plasmid replication protein (RepL)
MKPYLKKMNTVDVPALSNEGELYTAKKNIKIVAKTEESYFSLYNHIMGYMYGCTNLSEIKLLTWIGNNCDYNSHVVFLNKFNKTKIMESTGLSSSAIDKAIKKLAQEKILVLDTKFPRTGTYFINPTFIWKGDSNTRKKSLEIVLTLIKEADTPDLELETKQDIDRFKDLYDKGEI